MNIISEQIQKMKDLNLVEGLPLKLSKQIRQYQKEQPVDKELEAIFGANVYRLYYDLDNGKQITPNRKDPKLKLDIKFEDDLKNDITSGLAQFDYKVVDFEKNIAQNTRTNQSVRLSKVLTKLDAGLSSKYNNFLDSMTRNVENGKYYAVISRHSQDMAMMGTHAQSCENLENETDIDNTMIKGNEYDENPAGDGNGERAGMMIRGGDLIFYMIKEGDWNIQNPAARFADGVYCVDNGSFYGGFSPKFKAFIKKWLQTYKLDVKKEKNIIHPDQFFEQPLEKLVEKLFDSLYHGRVINTMDREEFVREIINRKRYDVLDTLLQKYKNLNLYKDILRNLINVIYDKMSPKIVTVLPENIKTEILSYVAKQVDELHKSGVRAMTNVNKLISNTDKFFEPLKNYLDTYLKVDPYQFIDLFVGLSANTITDFRNKEYDAVLAINKLVNPQLTNEVIKLLTKMDYYRYREGFKELVTIFKAYGAKHQQMNEQANRMRKLAGLPPLNEGKRYQSPIAAGALLVSKETNKCLVGLRSKICEQPGTWGPFGGSIEEGESINEGLLRELKEEIGFTGDVELHESWLFTRPGFEYHTFFGLLDKEFKPKLNDETDEIKWLTLEELLDLPKKHPGFKEFLDNAKEDLQTYMGDKKINEDLGGRKPVYHGTPDKRFSVTKNSMMGQTSDDLSAGDKGVIWFTDNRHTAQSYADPKRAWDYQNAEPGVLQRFIKCKNPLIVDAKGALWRQMNLNVNGTNIKGTRELVDYAKANGYDGICIKNVYDNYNHFKGENLQKKYLANTYAVFTDDQVSHNPH